jgi:chromosome segregation protein
MQFKRLRLSGFKSFVEPVDLDILPGVTGVVGPNGCGKSNLLEALRWVMGETSYKSMRGSGMEDVIFAGTNARPARNHAEVLLFLDNENRTAPAEYNDAEGLEIVRRIERDAGSAYRINSRDVRARDVQLLFADASTGARSTSLVRQGQIGELINAKPEARRMILEEAAGISGLHSRRHEAELRLRAAENNLEKVDDALQTLETEFRQLKRQARQASRYKNISGQIRGVEATALHIRWHQACVMVEETAAQLVTAGAQVSAATQDATTANVAQAAAHERLPALRESEAEAAAALRHVLLEQEGLEAEAQRAQEMVARLETQLATIAQDMAREEHVLQDAAAQETALAEEKAAISNAASADEAEMEAEARADMDTAAQVLADAEARLEAANRAMADQAARRQACEMRLKETAVRQAKLETDRAKSLQARSDIENNMYADIDLSARQAELDELISVYETTRAGFEATGKELSECDARRQAATAPAEEARADLNRLVGEVTALSALFASADDARYPALVDKVEVAAGFEMALGAAIGDDLEASSDTQAPSHWRDFGSERVGQDLPAGVEALAAHVTGSQLLLRRLSQVGIVERAQGATLQKQLLPGQRLVSREGDVWRWDGFAAAADAPSAAATRLAQRNRLDELAAARDAAEAKAHQTASALEEIETQHAGLKDRHEAERIAAQDAQNAVSVGQQQLAQAEAGAATDQAKLQALDTSEARIQADMAELEAARKATDEALKALANEARDLEDMDGLRGCVVDKRNLLAEARARFDGFYTQRQAREQQLARVQQDQASWQQRAEAARSQVSALENRRGENLAEKEKFTAIPEALAERRAKLADVVRQAEARRQTAADELAEAETTQAAADKTLRACEGTVAEAREKLARLEATQEANNARAKEAATRIREALQIAPEEAAELAGIGPEDALPDAEGVEAKLEKLRRERENLGGVNLRAEEEADEIKQKIETMTGERDELAAAINKLRHGIGQLNREGRQRLLAAFDTVNGHFGRLFTQLFGGGSARLELSEGDDPLEAGLEIIAHPPGKKPQVMSLLSGGEQALTAMAMIFAVFLTNPSPICVLDEVDAPLDDANVERFCNLVREIADETGTRFLLITHHALTMARVDRLFGVTMQERGVSQLISVDLTTAEQFAENGRDKNAGKEEDTYKSTG